MTWSQVGSTTDGTAVASGNVSGTLPSGLQAGDVLFATVLFRGTATFTTPSGWSLVGSQLTGDTLTANNGIAGISQYIAYRDTTDPGTTWNRTAGDLGLVRISAFRSSQGAVASGNLRASSVVQTSGQVAGAAVSAGAGITPDVNGCLLYHAFCAADSGTISALNTVNIASGSWTALGSSASTTTGADGTIHAAYHVQTTAAATGNQQGTSSVGGQNALSILAVSEPTPISPPPVPRMLAAFQHLLVR